MIQYYSQSVTESVVGSVKKLRVLSKYLYFAPPKSSKGFLTLRQTHFFTCDQYSQTDQSFVVFPLLFTTLILMLEIFLSYKVYARVLKWLTFSLLAYPLTAFIVAEPWPTILRATLLPHIEFNFQFLFIITGVLGTTISPYMFFWQASEETEEERAAHLIGKDGRPRINWGFIHNMRIDTLVGMLFSQVVTWAIIVVTATVLHANSMTDIRTAADAARALEP